MKKLFLIALIGFVNLAMNAQGDNTTALVNFNFDIPAISILDIQTTGGTGNPISFPLEAPTEAGMSFLFPAPNSDQWLNYTVMRETTATTKKISVKTSSAMPPGLRLKIDAIASINHTGTVGSFAPGLFVSLEDQVLITGIGTSATGDGVDFGHQIMYTLQPSTDQEAYSMLSATNYGNKTITYTMSDE